MSGWIINYIKQVVSVRPPEVFITEWAVMPSHTTDALDANDAIGSPFTMLVPTSGLIHSATLLDRDDEGSELDVALFSGQFTGAAGDVAFSLSDEDAMLKIMELSFSSFNDNVNNQSSVLVNIGKAYRVPPLKRGSKMGLMYAQGITRGTPTIAAGSEPMVRLEILPDWPVSG